MHTVRLAGRLTPTSWIAAAIVLLGGCSAPADQHAANDPDHAEGSHEHAAAEDAGHERAVEITAKMLAVYRAARSYAGHATYVEESVLRGEGVARQLPYYEISLAFVRPNQIRLDFVEALADAADRRQGFHVGCDGELLRALLPEIPDQMVENPAPAQLTAANVLVDPLIEEKLLDRSLGDVLPQLAMLLDDSDADEAAVFPLDANPRLLANERLDGRECYRVATSHPEGTRVFWIDAKSYVLRRMELPTEAHRRRIDPDGHFLRLSVRIDFPDGTFDAKIDPKTFALEPPVGAHRVRRFVLPAEELTAKEGEETAKDAKDAKDAKGDGEEEDLTD